MDYKIENPGMWSMGLRLSTRGIEAACASMAIDGSLIYKRFKPSLSIEDIVFDNPLLTLDFAQVVVILETEKVMAVPSGLTHDEQELLFKKSYGNSLLRMAVEPLPQSNAQMLFGIDPSLASFLNRTYPQASVRCHLGQLCGYFNLFGGGGNQARMFAVLRDRAVDVIALSGSQLLAANTLAFDALTDAVYYILATRQTLGLPQQSPVFLSGSAQMRASASMQLRGFVPKVLPAVFPPELFALGPESQKVPLDLISSFLQF